MDILPILATLKRHKTAAGLIVLQVALTCAIVCNALFLIAQRMAHIGEVSGLAESELVVLAVSGLSRSQNPDATTRADVQALRALPGVKSVSLSNQISFDDNFSSTRVRLKPEELKPGEHAVGAALYFGYDHLLATLGLKLVAGRDFTAEEYLDLSVVQQAQDVNLPAIIINQALAEKLFPGVDPIGQSVYVFGSSPTRVVGVVQQLGSPQPGGTDEIQRFSMVFPARPAFNSGVFVLRVEPSQRQAVLAAAGQTILKNDSQRIVRGKRTLSDMRTAYYQQDVNMAWLMGVVCIALLAVTAVGIVGLASFWVQQRTRMIGTRRAMGATGRQIQRYFQTENFLLTSLGIVLGMVAAYGISLLLMKNYELPRLPFLYLPVGALSLWLLGQIAVLLPARRAAALAPVVALRA